MSAVSQHASLSYDGVCLLWVMLFELWNVKLGKIRACVRLALVTVAKGCSTHSSYKIVAAVWSKKRTLSQLKSQVLRSVPVCVTWMYQKSSGTCACISLHTLSFCRLLSASDSEELNLNLLLVAVKHVQHVYTAKAEQTWFIFAEGL